ncbi:MAG: NADP-dependent phosphogluconate dehydrogenase [Anaerolineales bacterium]|nr:NADP-dependent phosphogluconate dehydrogenase [Anaerolineales bacterium]MDW8446887.1 NADP-dependent phosphogluconate dehydrogenase [Anaerolineales bacterium]
MALADLAVIGLAVMGQNLALNIERNGYRVAVYNRTLERMRQFLAERAQGKQIIGCETLPDLVASLKRPRRLLIMVKAGSPVDQMINELLPHLEPGDILIDGGNSFFKDTERRLQEVEARGLLYLGIGISGGEEGALKGPSLMPSGHPEAYRALESLLQAIAAKVDGEPCVTYLGRGGAGHYIKMVHNGIEYADMQLIAETYDLLRRGLGLSAAQIAQTFAAWNQSELNSYLIEITAQILGVMDTESGEPLVEKILDVAEQKGTGRWTSQEALELGVPIPTLQAAVEARALSAQRSLRLEIAPQFSGLLLPPSPVAAIEIDSLKRGLYAAKICAYAQGMAMLEQATRTYQYEFDLSEVARIWRGGCIIRARLLEHIRRAYRQNPHLPNLILDPFFRQALLEAQPAWRETVQFGVGAGIPLPAMSAALAYFDGLRSERLPANLIQAQRDYFGAHTYRRLDREGVFHTEWQA